MTALLGFVPDLPVTTPGAMVECQDMIPSDVGFDGAPSAIDVLGVGALPSACRGGFIGLSTVGVRRFIAGTQTKLYAYGAAVWDDLSRPGDYVGSSDSRWSFCQFGDFTIAANGVDTTQASAAGDFANIAGAPKAKIVVSAANFVMALNTDDATYGVRADAWWCSGIFDHTTWAPSISTQANTGRLVSAGGPITAGLAFGEQVVAYKATAMFLGAYVGGTAVWDWQQVQGDIGCVGPEAVCDAMGVHVFVGDDNIWSFDGVRPRPIADGAVRQWFINNSSPSYRYRTIVTYDRRNNRVWIFFPSTGTTDGTLDRALVYHMVTGKWGRADRTVDAVVTFVEPGITYDTLPTVAATFDDIPNISYDSQFWLAGTRALAVFAPGGQAQTLTGPSLGSSFTTWDIGSDVVVTHVDRVTAQFNTTPPDATCGAYTRRVSGGDLSAGSSATFYDGSFRLRQSGRWHVITINFNGPVSIAGIEVSAKPVGLR